MDRIGNQMLKTHHKNVEVTGGLKMVSHSSVLTQKGLSHKFILRAFSKTFAKIFGVIKMVMVYFQLKDSSEP